MDSKWWNSESKTLSADSNLGPRCEASGDPIVLPRLGHRCEASGETIALPRLGPRCEASGETIALPRLEPRVEARNETRGKRSLGGRNSEILNLV
ncbi:hypothetical protein AVEN_27910-1 [Araneus ventricosus]|uniref:Uncharacterized protein n=1 Tax=Araneus ventricosus TaxID=182803 RepID=A0A4Y2HLF0_ARAVE|nr:hypothetical protein AVEN_27910-1 [Araneus ventricosus]